MKKIFPILIIIFLCSCSPRTIVPLTDQQVDALETPEAIHLWKKSQENTDGCSSPSLIHWYATTFMPAYQWDVCCLEHDGLYGYGYKFGITKDQADYDLWSCVVDSGHPFVANVIYDGVWIGGGKYFQTGEK